ncbi:MAG: beta-ketoacyl-ACP synthase 3 [Eubacterium sp.]|nr:beta-ketoacyl-ACP synthase 3 [Eubacterium sp.]
MSGLQIAGLGRQLPARLVTNDEIAGMTDTDDAWIRSRSGIETRYFCGEESLADLACSAAERAMKDAGVPPEEIGICIVATATGDFVTPSTAAILQRRLGFREDIPAFDLNAACTGFIYGLQVMDSMLRSCREADCRSTDRYGLLVGGERLSGIIDPAERSTFVLFGDGAGAAVVKLSEGHRFFSRLGVRGDTEMLFAPKADQPEPWLHMNGKGVFRFAAESIARGIELLEQDSKVAAEDVDYIVCHQANRRIIEHVRKQRNLPEEKFYMNLQRYGNTSAASIPLALADMKEEGLLTPGTRLFMIGFGAGLTRGAAYLEM